MRFCVLFLLLFFALFAVILFYFFSSGYRINISESVPKGIWKIRQKNFSLGSFVLFCPPKEDPIFKEALSRGYIYKGFCPGGYAPLLKKVVGLPTDIVSFRQEGLWVNGVKILGTKPFLHDAKGKKLPFLRFENRKIQEGEVLLLVPGKPISFDSRYFGLVLQKYIIGEVYPILVY